MRCRDQYLCKYLQEDDKTTNKYYENYEAAPQGLTQL